MMSLFLKHPFMLAPMAGIATPELIASVSKAGALGSIGAGYMQQEEIRCMVRNIRALTSSPFHINLFIPPQQDETVQDLSSTVSLLEELWKKLAQAEPFPPDMHLRTLPSFEQQMQVVFEENIPILSFTFGLLDPFWVKECKKRGIQLIGTATTPEEAMQLEQIEVDFILCQGSEAGGHRGSFSPQPRLYSLEELLVLTQKLVKKTPLIGAGGIMNGAGVAKVLSLGAIGASLGTVFLTSHESGAHPTYQTALLQNPSCKTTLTSAFTGKPARALVNALTQMFPSCHPIPPYPIQHFLTERLRTIAASQGNPEFMSLWAGEQHCLCQKKSAEEIVQQIAHDLKKQAFFS